MSETTYKGSCFCGSVEFEATGAPAKWVTVIVGTALPGQPPLSTHLLSGPRKVSRW